jgi:methylenetetrahydrofolate dehydrogenase (NADP+)/methenyltetrahydrofolate cyclohydrolase
MIIIDGRKIRDEILTKIREEVSNLSFVPVFCDVLVGNDSASVQYVKIKERTAESVGISFKQASFPEYITTEELIREIKALNKVPKMCGIIIQLPLPRHIDRKAVLDAIDPALDVDCLGAVASDIFYSGDTKIGFPAALSCMVLLDSLNLNLANKRIVVLGQGMLVGRPVTYLLHMRNLSPEIITNETLNKEEIIKQADILISGMGKGKYLIGVMIKKGAILIDAGTSESEGGIIGDVDSESVKEVAGYLSPVPGGVGPVTVAMLLHNVLTVAKNLKQNE